MSWFNSKPKSPKVQFVSAEEMTTKIRAIAQEKGTHGIDADDIYNTHYVGEHLNIIFKEEELPLISFIGILHEWKVPKRSVRVFNYIKLGNSLRVKYEPVNHEEFIPTAGGGAIFLTSKRLLIEMQGNEDRPPKSLTIPLNKIKSLDHVDNSVIIQKDGNSKPIGILFVDTSYDEEDDEDTIYYTANQQAEMFYYYLKVATMGGYKMIEASILPKYRKKFYGGTSLDCIENGETETEIILHEEEDEEDEEE